MSLVKSPMTPKRLAANRANALKSTGPRTRSGKLHSRLNALKDGTYSALLDRYLRLWFQTWVNGPNRPPDWWRFAHMPVPLDSCRGDFRRGEEIRDLLWKARHYLPLGERRRFTITDINAQCQPVLPWEKLKESFFSGRSQEAVENTRGVAQKLRPKRQNELPANPQRSPGSYTSTFPGRAATKREMTSAAPAHPSLTSTTWRGIPVRT